MNKKFNGTIVETSGVRSVAGGGTGATTAAEARLNIGASSVNSVSTGYTLALSDAFNIVLAAAALTITVPPNSSVEFPIGSQVLLIKTTASAVSIAAGVGVTINAPGVATQIASQYSMANLIKVGSDSWILGGDIF